jgi:Cft2 family RNA processing exonuclease
MPNSIDDFENNLDKRLEQKLNSRNRSWFYIRGSEVDNKGRNKSFLIGPFTYEKANDLMERKRFVSAEIIELGTSDLARAGQMLKFRRLNSGEGIGSVMERVKHKGIADDSI